MYLFSEIAGSNDVQSAGEKSRLKSSDQQFIEFAEKLVKDEKRLEQNMLSFDLKTLFGSNEIYGKNGVYSKKLDVCGYSVERIQDFEMIFNPSDSGSIKLSFWKTDNSYFFLAYGGCEVLEVCMFGPFKFPFSDVRTINLNEVKNKFLFNVNPADIQENSRQIIFIPPTEPVVEKTFVGLTSSLRNPTEKDIEIIVFAPVLNNPKNPFILELKGKSIGFKSSNRPPPEPPPPLSLIIPANSRVKFETRIQLKDYTYDSGALVELHWLFHHWSGEKPNGLFHINLV